MQFLITFLLVTGTTSQILPSTVDDQIQNSVSWFSPTFTQQLMWLKDLALGTTNGIIHFPSDLKDKVMNVLNVPPSVPNIPIIETIDDDVEKVKIYTKTVVSQDLVTDN